jgi:hypothetical protein
MDFVKWLFNLAYYYEADKKAGKPYWTDPAFVGLVISIIATEAAKYAGLHVDADLQLKIVGSITGIGVLFSPHTGIKPKPAQLTHDPPPRASPEQAAQLQAKAKPAQAQPPDISHLSP